MRGRFKGGVIKALKLAAHEQTKEIVTVYYTPAYFPRYIEGLAHSTIVTKCDGEIRAGLGRVRPPLTRKVFRGIFRAVTFCYNHYRARTAREDG